MATATITIKNGRIVSHYDRYFVSLSENGKEYCGNGWVVKIKDGRKDRPGRIICHAEHDEYHREFRLADGTLGLASGYSPRYAYFRSEDFQEWLEDHSLRCVKREDPNQVYWSINPVDPTGYWSHGLQIETDGTIESSYDDGERCQVTGATYAVIRQRYCDGFRWHTDLGVLYTQVKDVTTIKDISSKKVEEEKKRQRDRLVAANAQLREKLEEVLAPYQGEGGGCPSLEAITAVEAAVNSRTLPTVREKEFRRFCWSYGSDRMFAGRCSFGSRNSELGAKKGTKFSRHEEITATIRRDANPKTYGEVFSWVEGHKGWLHGDITLRRTFYRVVLTDSGRKVRVEYVRTFRNEGWRQLEDYDPRNSTIDTIEYLWEGVAVS